MAPDVDLEDVRLVDAEGAEGAPLQTVGATTASVRLGPRVGCTVGLLDVVKGVVPVLLLQWIAPGRYYFLVAAVFVVVGHDGPASAGSGAAAGSGSTYGGFLVVHPWGRLSGRGSGLRLFVVRDLVISFTSGLWFFLVWLTSSRTTGRTSCTEWR